MHEPLGLPATAASDTSYTPVQPLTSRRNPGYFPNGPHGHPGWGLYVDSLPKALLTALVCLVAFLLFNYVVVATARAHALVARGLLSEPADPLEEAKEVLRSPGPLSAAEAAGHPVL